jgi:hypothetical protein
MGLQIKGIIKQILKPESGTSRAGNVWKKQEFVIETKDQFPKAICFTLFNDKVALIDRFINGDEVDVLFNIESREFNGKWFHNINAWKIEKSDGLNANEPSYEYKTEDIPPEPKEQDFDGLPF